MSKKKKVMFCSLAKTQLERIKIGGKRKTKKERAKQC